MGKDITIDPPVVETKVDVGGVIIATFMAAMMGIVIGVVGMKLTAPIPEKPEREAPVGRYLSCYEDKNDNTLLIDEYTNKFSCPTCGCKKLPEPKATPAPKRDCGYIVYKAIRMVGGGVEYRTVWDCN